MSCAKATYLLAKKGSSTLSLWERFRLFSHLGICRFCRRFKRQTEFLQENAANSEIEISLPLEVKNRIKNAFI